MAKKYVAGVDFMDELAETLEISKQCTGLLIEVPVNGVVVVHHRNLLTAEQFQALREKFPALDNETSELSMPSDD